jgi:hypothetical protein
VIGARTARGLASSAALALSASCALPSDAATDPANIVGTWTFVGVQTTPSASLEGTLTITSQDGDLINGTLSWVEEDAVGNTTVDGGPVTGRVIGSADVDFDLLRPGGSRRHVAHLEGDVMEGNWLQPSASLSGSFTATRVVP